jgi:hypothetical protein
VSESGQNSTTVELHFNNSATRAYLSMYPSSSSFMHRRKDTRAYRSLPTLSGDDVAVSKPSIIPIGKSLAEVKPLRYIRRNTPIRGYQLGRVWQSLEWQSLAESGILGGVWHNVRHNQSAAGHGVMTFRIASERLFQQVRSINRPCHVLQYLRVFLHHHD